MLTFHNDQKIKDKYLARLMAHAAADEIVKGQYWENGKGCAVGCTVHSCQHSAYENELGIPRLLARLEDGIFEGLSNHIAKDFPLRFLNAVPVGVDLKAAMIFEKFMLWLLIDETYGVYQYGSKNGKDAIRAVSDLYKRKISGKNIDIDEWLEARKNSTNDAAAAAYAAADDIDAAYANVAAAHASRASASAADAAYAAVDDAPYTAVAAYANATDASAAYANVSASYASRASAHASRASTDADARYKHRVAQANKLIELLENCK